MEMVIDGVMVNVLDDAELLRFCERRAALRVSATPKHVARADLERALILGTFAAAKFGALCAAIKMNPATPVEVADLYLLADMVGESVGLRLNLSTAEVHRDEGSEDEAGGAAEAGDGGGSGGGEPVAPEPAALGGDGGEGR